uniref:(northern house mosquito) hypothetical protein n=1 Tax=Culex pipiens TaxID=7175 RepID=A0A8D8DP46_CULPI
MSSSSSEVVVHSTPPLPPLHQNIHAVFPHRSYYRQPSSYPLPNSTAPRPKPGRISSSSSFYVCAVPCGVHTFRGRRKNLTSLPPRSSFLPLLAKGGKTPPQKVVVVVLFFRASKQVFPSNEPTTFRAQRVSRIMLLLEHTRAARPGLSFH